MKKLYFILIILLVTGYIAEGQSKLEMIHPHIEGPLYFGDSFTFVYTLLNTGTVKYSDSIKTSMYTNLATNPFVKKINQIVIDTGLNDTVQLRIRFPVIPPYFQQDVKSIIVIWPTGTGTKILGDTFKAEDVQVYNNVSVIEQNKFLTYVRFYPNPSKDILHFKLVQPGIRINIIRLADIQGRTIPLNAMDLGSNAINLVDFKPGIYILEVEFSDQNITRHRIIKTQ